MNQKSESPPPKRTSIGRVAVDYKNVASILTPASGFMDLFDYTMNPYSGCAFGCTYCYAAFFSRTLGHKNSWGSWVQVKENALVQLQKLRKKPLINKTIYISSVTDPYQPLEAELRLTRSLLQELAEHHQARIVIQTRSPLVTADIDVFQKFQHIQVNMTVTTDSETVRKVFEPYCPSNSSRLKAIKTVADAGIPACITMTPLLPLEDIDTFIGQLKATGITKFTVQPFHTDKGKFVAGTRQDALDLLKKYHWSPETYVSIQHRLQEAFPDIGIGKNGFNPV